jgi:mRNA-degrading endonuclease RelE of RelBE toxin-antitoxin system
MFTVSQNSRRFLNMVNIKTSDRFNRIFLKLDRSLRIQIDKLIDKIISNPEIGKPMRHNRRGTREVYAGSFRLSYAYNKNVGMLILLDFYHKDKQ